MPLPIKPTSRHSERRRNLVFCRCRKKSSLAFRAQREILYFLLPPHKSRHPDEGGTLYFAGAVKKAHCHFERSEKSCISSFPPINHVIPTKEGPCILPVPIKPKSRHPERSEGPCILQLLKKKPHTSRAKRGTLYLHLRKGQETSSFA